MSENKKNTFTKKPAHFESKSQIAPNSLIYNRNLSDAAIRLILALNAIPDSWIIVQCDIQQRLGWGREKMQNAIKECVQFGFMKVTQSREKGQFSKNNFEFDTSPSYLEKPTHNEYEPLTGFPLTDEPAPVNQALLVSSDNTLDIEYTTTHHQEETKESASPVVVFSYLEKLDIPETLKAKITQEYSSEEIEKAVDRTLAWADRPNDKCGILTTLKKSDEWVDKIPEDQRIEINKQFLDKHKYLDMKKQGPIEICIGPNYIEIVCGPTVSKLCIDEKDFIFKFDALLEKYKIRKK